MPYIVSIFGHNNKMVGKMKLKLCTYFALFALMAGTAHAAAPRLSQNAGLRYINTRGEIRCGTESDNKILAYQDDKGNWQGIDVELCKLLSTAVFGRSDRIKMVPLAVNQVSKALYTNQIDVMVGGLPYSATTEISTRAAPVDVWYYDRQVFLAHAIKGATSMEAYKGKKVCVVNNTDNLAKLRAYNDRYQLDFSVLTFPTARDAKNAFLLNRCHLLTGNSMLLRDLVVNSPAGVSDVEMLPETIVTRPIYVYADKDNATLRSLVKWAINAVKQAEAIGLNSNKVDFHLSVTDPSMRYLLGLDEKLWNRFKVTPTWLQTYLKENGNYGEVFENTIGKNSRFKIERNENKLVKDDGLMFSTPFI